MDYKQAKRFRRKYYLWQSYVDRLFTWGSSRLGMCGDGVRHNWSVMFAELFFLQCPCCLFYRGVTIGAVLGLVLGAFIVYVF